MITDADKFVTVERAREIALGLAAELAGPLGAEGAPLRGHGTVGEYLDARLAARPAGEPAVLVAVELDDFLELAGEELPRGEAEELFARPWGNAVEASSLPEAAQSVMESRVAYAAHGRGLD